MAAALPLATHNIFTWHWEHLSSAVIESVAKEKLCFKYKSIYWSCDCTSICRQERNWESWFNDLLYIPYPE